MSKSWIGVDLDRTLAVRNHGDPISKIGRPIEMMVNRVRLWHADGIRVKIVTARVASCEHDREDQRRLVRSWCLDIFGVDMEVTSEKDRYMLELWDDLAVRVQPNIGIAMSASRDSGMENSFEFAKSTWFCAQGSNRAGQFINEDGTHDVMRGMKCLEDFEKWWRGE